VILIGIVIFIGLAYPLILFANHMPIDFSAIMVPFMTILTIFTFCYAPYYFLFGGAVFAIAWATAVIQIDGFPISLGANEAFGFIFLTVGILQRYIRRRSEAAQEESVQMEPESKKVTFAEMVEQARVERRQREYDALCPEDRAAKTASSATTTSTGLTSSRKLRRQAPRQKMTLTFRSITPRSAFEITQRQRKSSKPTATSQRSGIPTDSIVMIRGSSKRLRNS
jgi:hypothetical protein